MIACVLCGTECSGHHAQPTSFGSHLQLRPAPGFAFEDLKRDGMQPKDSVRLDDGSNWMVKYDAEEYAHIAVNEWLTMDLVKSAGFDCAEYGLTQLADERTLQVALTVEYFDILKDPNKVLISGLNLLDGSETFISSVQSMLSTDDPEEFTIVSNSHMQDLTMLDAVDIFNEAGVNNMPEVFKFFVMAEVLNHSDCHLGNVGFIRDTQTGGLSFSPVYDVNNFAVYKANRIVLRANEHQSDLDSDTLARMAEKCGVSNWETVVAEMLENIQKQLPISVHEAASTTWLYSSEYSQKDKENGPSTLTDFLSSFRDTIEHSIKSLQKQLPTKASTAFCDSIVTNDNAIDLLSDAWDHEDLDACVRISTKFLASNTNTLYVLDAIPKEHPNRDKLEDFLNDVHGLRKLTGDHELMMSAMKSARVMDAVNHDLMFDEKQLQNAITYLSTAGAPRAQLSR